jgi:GNAT superfamily N-acetyltransferase
MKADPTTPAIHPVTSVFPVLKGLTLTQAESPTQIAQARELFLEYAKSLGFSLCFQNFDQELAGLPGDYSPPEGRFLLAECDGQPAVCVALHKLDSGICEMKRLYLRPQFHGKGLGRTLAERIMAEARQIGYPRMRLDTVGPAMKDAVAMYRKLGFKEIAPYRPNPNPGTMYYGVGIVTADPSYFPRQSQLDRRKS